MTVRAAFTFANHGGAPATGVRVRLNHPEGLVYLVGSGLLDGALLDDELGNSPLLARAGAAIGDVAPGQERRIEIGYSVAGAIENGTTVEIQAAVASFEVQPVGSNVVRLIARSKPQLRNEQTLAGIEARGEAAPGGEALITVRVYNAGESSARDVVVVAAIPERTRYLPGSVRINGREPDGELSYTFDRVYAPILARTLASGATATLQYRVRIDAPLPDATTIALRTWVASQESAAFELPEAQLVISAAPDFSDDRTNLQVEPAGEIRPGERVQAIVTLQNVGSARANRATVAIQVDPALIYVRGSARLDGEPLRERKRETLQFEIGALDATERAELSLQFIASSPLVDSSELIIRARISWEPSGRDAEGERNFERTLAVSASPRFSSRLNRLERLGGQLVHPSERVEAQIVLTNNGPAEASGVVVQLAGDPSLEGLELYEKGEPHHLIEQRVALGSIEAFTSRTLLLAARVRTPLPDRSEMPLSATLISQECGEQLLGEVRWLVDSHAVFAPESSRIERLDDGELRPNHLAEILLHLENVGSDHAQNVHVRLFIAPEARIESVEGATRAKAMLLVGEIPAGQSVDVRVSLRLLRSIAREFPLSIDAVVTADSMLPVPLDALTIATMAQPDFAYGTLRSDPSESVEVGEQIEWSLHVRNSGDGSSRRVQISLEQPQALIYVPNSTSVNEVPVRDVGALPPFASEHGIVLTDVDPGVDATIRWRDVVHNQMQLGESIARVVRIAYDGERVDEIVAEELRIRATPLLAGSIAGLPFGVDGVLGPMLSGPRALEETRYIELPPATPVARESEEPDEIAEEAKASPRALNGEVISHASAGTLVVFSRERLAQLERQLGEVRPGRLVGHLFVLRALLPDAIGAARSSSVDALRESLRESLDRLFIKLRIAHYAMVERELETPSLRATIEAAIANAAIARGAPTAPPGSFASLGGRFDGDVMQGLCDRLTEAPLASALPWYALAHLLPDENAAAARYRRTLIAALGALLDVEPREFLDRLTRTSDEHLDAELVGLRESLLHLESR